VLISPLDCNTDYPWEQMTLNDTKGDVKVIQESLRWHARIGWIAITACLAAFIALLTWYIPKELNAQKTDIVQAIQLKLDDVEKLQIAKLSAQIGALGESNTKLDAGNLLRLNSTLSEISENSNPQVSQLAWSVHGELLAYKSSLNRSAAPQIKNHRTVPVNKASPASKYLFSLNLKPNANTVGTYLAAFVYVGPKQDCAPNCARLESLTAPSLENSRTKLIIVDGTQDTIVLDNSLMKNVVIRNASVEYDGGPVKLENVYFVNCKFILPVAKPDHGFSETLLTAQDAIDFSTNS
jgi:hypothetical protein